MYSKINMKWADMTFKERWERLGNKKPYAIIGVILLSPIFALGYAIYLFALIVTSAANLMGMTKH